MKERDISLDAIKGFVILLVMLGHILILNEMNDSYIYPMIAAVQMPAFIMVSGYISGLRPPIESFLQWKHILSKRAVCYLLPFFTWLFLKQWDNLIQGTIYTVKQLDRGLWFLMTLFVLNVMLYTTQLLNRQFQKKSELAGVLGFCFFFGAFAGVFVIQYSLGILFLSPELTLRYSPPFIVGYFASRYKNRLKEAGKDTVWLILAIVSGVSFGWLSIRFEELTTPLWIMLKGLLGCYVIFYLFLKSKKNVIKEKLAIIGNYTLEIYTLHFHFVAKRLKFVSLDFELYSIKGFVFVILSFVGMSIITVAMIYLAKQSAFTNLLLFGRKEEDRLLFGGKNKS